MNLLTLWGSLGTFLKAACLCSLCFIPGGSACVQALPFQMGLHSRFFPGQVLFFLPAWQQLQLRDSMPSHCSSSFCKERGLFFQKALQKYYENLGLCCVLLISSCNLLHAAYIGYACPVRILLLSSTSLFKMYALKRFGYMITNFSNPELLEAEGPQNMRLD